MVVTSSVSLAGVLLVFSYLIIPTFFGKNDFWRR
jgi:ABC-type Mn2+/Zn2+ transport system permease subunit